VSRVLKSPGRLVRATYDDLATTFFPADCSACGGPLLRADFTSVCNARIDALGPQTAELCMRSGEALDVNYRWQFGAETLHCDLCRTVPPESERAWGLYAVIAGKDVLLLDDIYTTGAKARECARVLRRAGAAKVWVATVARAERAMVAMWNEDAAEKTAMWDAE
jgi:predicted amidophosphoribosyltransferase